MQTTRGAATATSIVLTGTKRFITNADKADLFTVMARTGDEPGARGVSAFLVPRDLPGVIDRQAREEDGPAGRPGLPT